jgi:hypothetical protein
LVDLAEIQAAYYMVAATGVLVAAIYYVYNIRVSQKNQELTLKAQQQTLETRQADILQRHAQISASQEFMDAWHDIVFNQNYLTYEEWQRDYGPHVNSDAYTHHGALIQYYEILGGLLRENLVSIELVEKIWQPIHLICVWDRVEPVIKGWREVYRDGSMYENFEFLFNRFMERHPEAGLTRSVRHEQMVKEHEKKIRSLKST